MMRYGNSYGYPVFGAGLLATLSFLLIPLLIWGIFWKGWALWRAAKNDSKVWFVVFMILNTMGILDILYIFVFSRQKETPKKTKK
jgi:hypothetical protein